MSKIEIYKQFIENNICKFGDYKDSRNFQFNFHKLMSHPEIYIKVLEYISGKVEAYYGSVDSDSEAETETEQQSDFEETASTAELVAESAESGSSMVFKRVVATFAESYIFACDIATSNSKGIMIPHLGNNFDCTNIRFPDVFDIDEPVIVVVHMLTEENCENVVKIIKMLESYGTVVKGVLEIVNCNSGYDAPLILNNDKTYEHKHIFSIREICEYADNNNLVDSFYTEKFNFNAEVNTKKMAAKFA